MVQAAPIESPKAALAFIDHVSDANATHNCWAYRIGQQYRFSDDNEPAGTAGKPILQAIDGQNLDHLVVVVTRYFGGIKLGAGGLIRAYGGCAAECLRLAEKSPLVDKVTVRIFCDFSSISLIKNRLYALDAEKLSEEFSNSGVTLCYRCPTAQLDFLHSIVRDITRGHGVISELE